MRRLVVRIVPGVVVVAGFFFVSACGGGGSSSTTATASTSTSLAVSTSTESSTSSTSVPSSTTTASSSSSTSSSSTTSSSPTVTTLPQILPPTLFKKTDLFEAGVYIGVSSAPAVTAKWNVPVADSGEVARGTTTINGVTFAIFTSSEGAAGNIYEERTYRTVHKGTCLELAELLHSGEIGNYTPGTVVQFDKVKFGGYLEAIVDTFTFN